jgi:hypothetical protein
MPEPEKNEAPKPAFDLVSALPDTIAQGYNEGKFTSPDELVAALSGHYQNSFKAQGWKDKNDLIGTHNAFQNNIQKLVKAFDPDADFSTAKDTNKALELAQASFNALLEKARSEGGKKGNEGEESTSQKKQLAQLEAALKATAEEREQARKEVEEVRKNSILERQQIEDQYETRSVFSQALEATKGARIGVAEKAIMAMFGQEFSLQLVRDESGQTVRGADGKAQYRVIQKSTGNIIMDDRNGVPMSLDKVMTSLYKEMGILAQQPEQKAGDGAQKNTQQDTYNPIDGSRKDAVNQALKSLPFAD